MNSEEFYPVDESVLKEIGNKLYVLRSSREHLIERKCFIGIHFVIGDRVEILHDSPAIGAWEYGKIDFMGIKGPFFRLGDAEAELERMRAEGDNVRYEFRGKIESRFFNQNVDLEKIEFKKYSKTNYVIEDDPLFLEGQIYLKKNLIH